MMVTTMGPAALLAMFAAVDFGGWVAAVAVALLACFAVQMAAAVAALLLSVFSPSFRADVAAEADEFSAALCSAVNA